MPPRVSKTRKQTKEESLLDERAPPRVSKTRKQTKEEPILNAGRLERYARHILLPEIGGKGQRTLLSSKILVVGAGGLGCPALFYLAGAGIGTLGIIDDDHVERSNLQRQILHDDAHTGMAKARSAAIAIRRFNPDIDCHVHECRLEDDNVEELIRDYDIVIDGSDNFPTRYRVNDACHQARIPVIFAAVRRFEAQIMVLSPSGPCYRCLFPDPDEHAADCADSGILGAVAGIAGCLQAVEAIKVLLGIGRTLAGRLIIYDALEGRFDTIHVDPSPDCPLCSKAP